MILAIIAITALVSIMAMYNKDLFYRLKFSPYLILHSRQWYRLFTHAFVHAGWMHLLINMWVLYLFGQVVVDNYAGLFGIKGYYYFIILYVGAILISSLPSYGKYKDNPYYNAVGASGATSAVLFASILFYPIGKIMIFPIPIGIPAFIFGILYLIYSVYMSKRGGDNIGHDAHFWGAVFGVLFTIAIKPAVALYFIDQIRNFISL
ncbi:MAG TPA: rhomboid family intramembrane serine protease [Bacteroidales bacterium]|jgi:membrane associated rhomboid family serine protease|nr:rhomboid family intramembrane serine protease [Bacteroidales bacterium]HPI31252.1 rhomboid family intramembrane serine protease [Bacteroidales bacterium]